MAMMRAASDFVRVAQGASEVFAYQVELLSRGGMSILDSAATRGARRRRDATAATAAAAKTVHERSPPGSIGEKMSRIEETAVSKRLVVEPKKAMKEVMTTTPVAAASVDATATAALNPLNGVTLKPSPEGVMSQPNADTTDVPISSLKPVGTAAQSTENGRSAKAISVPATSFSRAVGFGSLGVRLLGGAMSEATRRMFNGASPEGNLSSVYLTEANAERIAGSLSRMRGAALKLGQMLSIQDKDLLPKELTKALETVRQNADYMPEAQLRRVLATELGTEWEKKFARFDLKPIAAASIGQVHRAQCLDGRELAVKVQYPGVATSIESDLNNLKRLITYTGAVPKSFFVDDAMDYAREELAKECDYVEEARKQNQFHELLADDDRFVVPLALTELSTKSVLTSEWVEGKPIDAFSDRERYSQEERDHLGTLLMELTIKELYELRFMQTDPNFSNFFYDGKRLALLDFGAARGYDKEFVDNYLRMVVACANKDREGILKWSKQLGFLTGDENQVLLDAHVAASLVVGEPFQEALQPYDFGVRNIAARAAKFGPDLAKNRLCPPPKEAYSLHRRLSGAFLICMRLGARVNARDVLMRVYHNYKF